jgi:hypothetical protein
VDIHNLVWLELTGEIQRVGDVASRDRRHDCRGDFRGTRLRALGVGAATNRAKNRKQCLSGNENQGSSLSHLSNTYP